MMLEECVMTEESIAHTPPILAPTLVIRPPRKWKPVDLREIWEYRELLYLFIWRDVKVRYKQTALGFLWVLIQPLFMMLIFSFFFGRLARIPSGGIPYALFALTALLPWILFSEGLTRATNSMVSNANIMTKVYYPRLIMPLAGILSPLIDFAIAFFLLVGIMIHFAVMPLPTMVLLPLFIGLGLLSSFGIGLWLSALNVMYRDFQYVVPFLIQIGLFASPIVYPSYLVPEDLRLFYWLNPMSGVIEGSRWALFGTPLPLDLLLLSCGVVVVLITTGLFYFRRMEQYFADVV
jgi:lipopolysaccharide transport system permease protein